MIPVHGILETALRTVSPMSPFCSELKNLYSHSATGLREVVVVPFEQMSSWLGLKQQQERLTLLKKVACVNYYQEKGREEKAIDTLGLCWELELRTRVESFDELTGRLYMLSSLEMNPVRFDS